MNIDRRRFVQFAGGSLVAASLPGWLGACTAQSESDDAPMATSDTGPAVPRTLGARVWKHAQASGSPLLVIVVPDELQEQYERGELFGVFVNNADRDTLADLALCGVVCLRTHEIRRDLPDPGHPIGNKTLAILFEADGSSHRPIEGVPPHTQGSLGALDYEALTADIERRNAWLATQLRAAIAPDRATIARRAEFARRAAAKDIGALDDTTEPTTMLAERVPAWVRLRAEDAGGATRDAWIGLLADRALVRLRAHPPAGSHWAHSAGCGQSIEDAPSRDSLVACGMGMVPQISQRFLTFFAEEHS